MVKRLKLSCLRLVAALLLVCLSGELAAAATRLALVIGNSNYKNEPLLSNPANDGKLIAGALTQAGFEVMAFSDLDQRAMKRAIRDFADKVTAAGDGAVALFYYAGHGLQVDGSNYLVPVDASIEKESDVGIEAINLGDVVSAIEFARASMNIVILDACRDNPLKRDARSAGGRGLARVDAPVSSIVAYATAPGQTAADGDGADSPYSKALAETLVTPGIPIEQVFKQVRIKVKDATGGKQVPWESSSLTSDFFFVKGDGAASPPAVTPPPAVEPPAAVETPPPPVASVEPAEPPAEPPAPPTATGDNCGVAPGPYRVVDIAPNDILSVRSAADRGAPEVGTIPPSGSGISLGRCVPVVGYKSPWCEVHYGCLSGWAYARYLADGNGGQPGGATAALGPAPAQGGAETYRVVGVANWDFLNLRAGPGTNFPIVTPIPPNGTGVNVQSCQTVLGYKTKWCQASWQGRSGWTSACCLVGERSGRPVD